jgi:hypothetical protein
MQSRAAEGGLIIEIMPAQAGMIIATIQQCHDPRRRGI